MNNQKFLYIIIGSLVVLNVVTLTYFTNTFRFNKAITMVMMGNDEHWKEHDEIVTWGDMVEHMEEEHGEIGMMHAPVLYDKPSAETHRNTYDFGQIRKEAGVVSTSFEIENHGKHTLALGQITTSCQCTSAVVDKRELGFNEKATLTVYFDPNLHEEPEDKFTRSVFVKTNDPTLPELQFDIYVDILE